MTEPRAIWAVSWAVDWAVKRLRRLNRWTSPLVSTCSSVRLTVSSSSTRANLARLRWPAVSEKLDGGRGRAAPPAATLSDDADRGSPLTRHSVLLGRRRGVGALEGALGLGEAGGGAVRATHDERPGRRLCYTGSASERVHHGIQHGWRFAAGVERAGGRDGSTCPLRPCRRFPTLRGEAPRRASERRCWTMIRCWLQS